MFPSDTRERFQFGELTGNFPQSKLASGKGGKKRAMVQVAPDFCSFVCAAMGMCLNTLAGMCLGRCLYN